MPKNALSKKQERFATCVIGTSTGSPGYRPHSGWLSSDRLYWASQISATQRSR